MLLEWVAEWRGMRSKIDIQAQAGNIEATAAKKVIITALEEIVLQAPKITHIAEGAGTEWGGNQIVSKTLGNHTVHAADHKLTGPASPSLNLPSMPQSEIKTDETFVVSGRGRQAREALPYKLSEISGKALGQGKTADNGDTEETQDTRIKGLNLDLKDE